MLVISFYPCADRYVSSIAAVESVADHVYEAKHKADTPDACSPFCACVCCAVSVNISLPSYVLDAPVQTVRTAKTIHPYPFVENLVYHIWQPPKLV
ncbi:hypothetical protein ACPDHL_02725 [Myroides sp. C15-4]|uniref:hypothetical protein n=1 Tax=Myroides sp. C15-4 TaxID=3400532 RepID=UPI003D2F79D9